MLAVHELVKVVLQVHFLISAVAYFGLPFTEQVNQEIATFVAIKYGVGVVLKVILVCNIAWRRTNALRALLQPCIIGSIINLAWYSESILRRRIYLQINHCKILHDKITLVNDYVIVHSYLNHAILERILLFFLLLLILHFIFLLHFLFLKIHFVRRVLLETASKLWLLIISIIIFITVIDDDGRLVLLLQSRQTILLLFLLYLLLLLDSVMACIGVDLLLDLVVTNHESIVTVLRLFRDVLILHEGELVGLRAVVRGRTCPPVQRAASLVSLFIAYATYIRRLFERYFEILFQF